MRIKELRAYFDYEDMMDGWKEFCINIAEDYNTKRQIAHVGNTEVHFVYFKSLSDVWSIGGMEFNRIHCDLRHPKDMMTYMMSRIRDCSGGPIEPMHVFYKKVLDR